MKRKKILLLFVSTCLILALAVSPFMAACAKPAVETGAAEIAALEKEVAALEKKVTAAEKGKTTSEKEVAALEKEIAAVEKEIAAAEKEIAKLEAAVPVPAEQYKWRLQSYTISTSMHGKSFVKYFKTTLDELSQGQIEVEWFDEGVLASAKDVAEAVDTGIVDLGHIAAHAVGTVGPVLKFACGVSGGLITPNELTTYFYDLGMTDVVRRAYAPHGCYFIGPTAATVSSRYFSKTPVYSLDDMRQLKLRTYGMNTDIFSKLGVDAVYIPSVEIYTALATGVIDAAIYTGPATNWAYGWHEIAKYWLMPPIHSALAQLIIKDTLWEELPSNLQTALNLSLKEWLYGQLRMAWYDNEVYYDRMKKEFDVVEYTLPAEDVAEIRAAAIECWDEVAGDDPLAVEAVDILKAYLTTMGRL